MNSKIIWPSLLILCGIVLVVWPNLRKFTFGGGDKIKRQEDQKQSINTPKNKLNYQANVTKSDIVIAIMVVASMIMIAFILE